jgi:hypothetical protein
MVLQVYYDIRLHKQQPSRHPDLAKLRPVLFWDTDIRKINWEKQKRSVIQRVFERGNLIEKEEISRFYGMKTIHDFIETTKA